MKRIFYIAIFAVILIGCTAEDVDPVERIQVVTPVTIPNTPIPIDFANWKVTLLVDVNRDGSADEVLPSQLVNGRYKVLPALSGLMYDDLTDRSIVFHTFFSPTGATTENSNYPRTELRELINPSNFRVNWNLNTGGTMKVRMKVVQVTDNYDTGSLTKDRFILAQIHGIIAQVDVSRLGLTSDSAPPLLKMQWRDGNMVAYKKTLRNDNTSGNDLYNRSDAIWTDISHNFGYVGYEPFDIEIKASTGRLEVIVNGQSHVFRDVSLQKWPFENYFKSGVYMQSTDARSNATVKMYSLNATH